MIILIKKLSMEENLKKDDIKNCNNCKLIHYQLKNEFNLFSEGVDENIFSYIGCSNCVDRMRYLEYDVSVLIHGLVGKNNYPGHNDIVRHVLKGYNTNLCIASIYSNAYEDRQKQYEHDFYAIYSKMYDKQIRDQFEDVYIHHFNEDKLRELRKLLLDAYKNKLDYYYDYIGIKDSLYHYLKIFSMITTYLNSIQVFYDLMK